MPSIKNLKKNINHSLGDIIEECYVWELLHPEKDNKVSQQIIDEAITAFDALLDRVNHKKVDNKKAHFQSIFKDLKETLEKLVEKVNAL